MTNLKGVKEVSETSLALLGSVTDPLAVLSGGNGKNAQGYSAQLAALLAEEFEQEQDAFDVQAARLKFPSGGLIAGFPTADGGMVAAPFEGVVLVAQKTRAWWPKKAGEQSKVGGPPLCSSPDDRRGHFNPGLSDMIDKAMQLRQVHPALPLLSDPDVDLSTAEFSCQRCPLAQYVDGEGTPCKRLRRLLVLVKGQRLPVILTVPTGSIKVFDQYASARTGEGKAYFTVWTKFELTKETSGGGHDYAKLKLTVAGDLTDEQAVAAVAVRREYGELVRTLELTADDYNTGDNGNGNGAPVEGQVVDGEAERVPF